MKRFFVMIFMLFSTLTLAAQSQCVAPVGVVKGPNGVAYSYPHSTLVVDLNVVEEQVIAGPYARYALKYLGLRAPFSDKTNYCLESATVALLDEDSLVANELVDEEELDVRRYSESITEFPELPLDRTELIQPAIDEAAAKAANRIFQLRRSRLDLIMGEAGEHVFGEGLEAALQEIDRQEQALLELFLGKQIRRHMTKRMEVALDATRNQYILCRFSEVDGLMDASNLMGEIVLLEVIPGEPYPVQEASTKAKSTMQCRVAAPSRCEVKFGGELLGSRTLPLFAFGRTVSVEY